MPGGNLLMEQEAELDCCVACGDHGCGICRARRKLQADGNWVKRPPGWTCTACGGHGGGCGLCRQVGSQEVDLTETYEAVTRQQRLWELDMERAQREAMQISVEAEAKAEAERRAREEAVGAFLREHGFSEVNAGVLVVTAGCCGRRQRRLTYPLHVAAAAADGEMVTFLLQEGADLHATDAAGRTPLEVARQRDLGGSHAVAVQCLEDALCPPAEEAPSRSPRPEAEQERPATPRSLGAPGSPAPLVAQGQREAHRSPKATVQRVPSKRTTISL